MCQLGGSICFQWDGRHESGNTGRLPIIQEAQVILAVGMVRSELLSRSRGIEVSLRWKSKNDTENIGRPVRHGKS